MNDMPEPVSYQVGAGEEGRLDVYLSARMAGVSRNRLQHWIEAGHVRVDGRKARASYRLRPGDSIQVWPPPAEVSRLIAEPLPLTILHEDESLVVVDKPAGMVVHPGAGNRQGTLANALLYHFREISRKESIRPGIVHRLDKFTSGVMVVAKTEAAHEALALEFRERRVEKRYLALLHGRLKDAQGRVDVPLGRHPRARTRISTRTRRPRQAVTEFRVIRLYRHFSYVEALPQTGRTHQIRVHFQHLGHPVVGDTLYAGRTVGRIHAPEVAAAIRRLRRHFLHAFRLSFRHPESGERVSFETPLPQNLEEFLSALE